MKTHEKSALRSLLPFLRPYRARMLLSLLSAAASVLGQLYIPILAGEAIDGMIYGGTNFSAIANIVLRVCLFAALAAGGQWLLSLCNNRAAYGVGRDLRNALARKFQSLPLSYLDSHPTGDLLSRAIADVDLLTDGLLMGFSQLFTGLLTILGTLFFMLSVSPTVALVVICVTPLSLLFSALIARFSFKSFQAQSKSRGEQSALLSELIEGAEVVRAFGHERKSLDDFDETNDRLSRESLRAVFISSVTNPATRFVNGVVYALVALVGSFSAIAGTVTVGALSCFLSYANQYTKPFNEISGVVTEMQSALACASRIFETLSAPVETPDGTTTLSNPDGAVEFSHVAFSYDRARPLIRDFNLSVTPGMRVAIVGPTGCGKTTLINLIMRFYDADGGQIRVSGRDIKTLTRHSLRANIGMVLQDTWLSGGTIADNIAYGNPSAPREQIVAAAVAAHADPFIRRLPDGYDTRLGEDGGALSQGQKQLICIARVMLVLPPMLILDEATSSIDTRTEAKIQSAFNAMTRGRTSFIVAHRLSTIRTADLILVMRDGQIVETGRHDQLLEQKGFYWKLYNSQFEGVEI